MIHRRCRRILISSCCGVASLAGLLLAPGHGAAAPRQPVDVQGLELADGRIATPPLPPVWGQSHGLDPRVAHPGLVQLRRELGPVWVAWSDERRAASGLMLASVEAPGTVGSPARAEAFARAFLERYLAVLAPGSAPADFEVVANERTGDTRTLGLVQRHRGRPVLGGQLGLRFHHDRLVLVSSQARPDVAVPLTATVVAPAVARAQARAFVAGDYVQLGLGVDSAAALEVAGPDDGTLVLPVWSGAGWTYHEVVRATVSSQAPLGRWAVYLDAATGEPIAREQQLRSAVTIRFDVPVRHPGSTRQDALAPRLDVTQGGMPATTNASGLVNITQSPTTIGTTVVGTHVQVVDDVGSNATGTFPGVVDGGTVVWSAAANEQTDAQLSAFVHASIAKEYVRLLAPGLPWLDQPTQVRVNLPSGCNALSDGDSLYFLLADGSCENTARLADVVYHESGHSVHNQSIIPGVGVFDSALSEGISDYLAATIVDDSAMGRGFFFNDDPLREIDPDGFEYTWPTDVSADTHLTGLIIAGTLWDLRQDLRTKYGPEVGTTLADTIWYESIRRATGIPGMYPEALAANDDDGDLANGTPDACEINAAFAAHGLLDPSQLGDVTIDEVSTSEGRDVVVSQSLPMFAGCPLDVGTAELRWRLRGDPGSLQSELMTLQAGSWVATIPAQATGVVVEYQVELQYADGSAFVVPRNPADPWYQTFFGAVEPIYCLDEPGDTTEWFFSGSGNTWSFGPLASDGEIDPGAPYDDDDVLLSQDGFYPPFANTAATGPFIDVSGHTDVRLHYRRWLSVEDGTYDHATIRVNEVPLWTNLVTPQGNVHHLDGEWRFHDLPLDDFLDDGQVQLQFALDSDPGLELGGWTIDALCVVEVVESVCGDGQVTGDEECDDGNTDDGDGCDASCVTEPPTGDDTTGGDSGDGSTSGGSGASGAVDETGRPPGDGSTGAGGSEGSSGGAGQDDAGGGGDGCGCTSGDEPRSGAAAAWLLLAAAGGLRRRRRSAQAERGPVERV